MRHVSTQTSARKLEAKKEMTTWDSPPLLLFFIPNECADERIKLHATDAITQSCMSQRQHITVDGVDGK